MYSKIEIENEVGRIRGGWLGMPPVTVVNSVTDLPFAIDSRANGAHLNGRVYIVADKISGQKELQKVLAHECVLHYGVETMLGEYGFARLHYGIQNLKKLGDKTVCDLAEDIRKRYGVLEPIEETKEIVARAGELCLDAKGEVKVEFGWMKRVFAGVAGWLRDHGIGVPFSNLELQGIMAGAQGWVVKGAELGGSVREGGFKAGNVPQMSISSEDRNEVKSHLNVMDKLIPAEEGDYLSLRDYENAIREQYVNADSRRVKNCVANPPVGSWLIDDFVGIYGREIEEVALIDIDNIEIKEDTCVSKWEDVRQYAEWLQDGAEAPPIRLMQTDSGHLVTMDHRRLLAAKAVGAEHILARVRWMTKEGEGLTFENSCKQAEIMPAARARDAYKIFSDDAERLARLQADLRGKDLKGKGVEFVHEVVDFHHGQMDCKIVAALSDGRSGVLSYTEYQGKPAISMIDVPVDSRRAGIGTALVRELQDRYPGVEIEWGMMTEDGARLRESLKFVEVPSEFAEKFERLAEVKSKHAEYEKLASKFDEIQSPVQNDRDQFLNAVSNWNDLHDELSDFENGLRGESPVVRLIAGGRAKEVVDVVSVGMFSGSVLKIEGDVLVQKIGREDTDVARHSLLKLGEAGGQGDVRDCVKAGDVIDVRYGVGGVGVVKIAGVEREAER